MLCGDGMGRAGDTKSVLPSPKDVVTKVYTTTYTSRRHKPNVHGSSVEVARGHDDLLSGTLTPYIPQSLICSALLRWSNKASQTLPGLY